MSKKKKAGKKAQAEQAAPRPRRAILAISPEAFITLFSGRHAYDVTENPIPATAKIVDVRMERWSQRGAIEILIEHDSIAELEEGHAVPYVKPPMFTSIPPVAPPATPPRAKK